MSNFLYADPSFLSGMSRTGDLFGTFDEYNESLDEPQADAIATFLDWASVGRDIRSAMRRVVGDGNDE